MNTIVSNGFYQSKRCLEIHIPKSFNSDRPALRFSHVAFDQNLSDHPLASRLPSATDGPSIQEGGDAFRHLSTQDRLPSTFEDYIYSDEPPLALHVVTFRDATIVSLNFPHALTDAVGLSALIRNWCRVLAGKEDEVDTLAQDDPLDNIGVSGGEDKAVEEYVLNQHKLAGWCFLRFVLNFVLELIFGPKMQTRLIYLPRESVQTLRQKAMDDLPSNDKANSADSTQKHEKPFISEGDVLSAWGTKMVGLGLGKQSKAMVVMNVFELRSRLTSLFDQTAAHVENAFFVLTTIFKPYEAQTLSVGQIALRLRSSLVAQTSEPQIKALIGEQKASLQATGRPAVFAEPRSILLPFSNWNKARFFDVIDFSPAVVPGWPRRRVQTPVGKPVVFISFDANPKPNPTHRNVFNILGKDLEGNYWITGMLSPATWAQVEKDVATL
ncbi:hypothetical protein VPNG_08069 [Cytospora leucostoma]|uniref:Uncharacterized protein n=1 Tax=Cytospora leucostoma TaxID=1230097 RepID=A0A423WSG6_9PEZI|nr:hypothetical protein VPNG_08069 [Cytospora leucostoma]